MPFSDDSFDAEIEAFLRQEPASVYLDLGAGAGKYGRMIRALNPSAKIIAVECEDDYIRAFDLPGVYDIVHHARLEEFFDGQPDFTADVILFGDVLEHLKKSDGTDVLHHFVYRCRHCVVVYPSKYVQYSWRGHASEAHRSVWTASDFAPFEARHITRGFMNLVIVKGFLADPGAVFPPDDAAGG